MMARSGWKTEFDVVSVKFFSNICNTSARITENFLEKRVYIYTGKKMFSIIMHEYMLGHCFGQYFRTKRLGDFHPISVKRRRGKKPKSSKDKYKKFAKRKGSSSTRKRRNKGGKARNRSKNRNRNR